MLCVVCDDEVWKTFFSSSKKLITFFLTCVLFCQIVNAQTIKLTWNKNPENDVEYYSIFKGQSSNPTNEIAQVNANDTTYFDNDIEQNQEYYYRITAVDSAGNISEYSDDESILVGPIKVSITGHVKYTASDIALANTKVNLSGDAQDTLLSNEYGEYQFFDLPSFSNYEISAYRNSGFNAMCILSYDASLVARMAVNLLPDPLEEQTLAADIDNNGTVQTYDAALIAQYAVGITNANNARIGGWYFNPADRVYNNISNDSTDQNFNAIIVGDVDANWNPSAGLNKISESEQLISTLEDLEPQSGKNISIPFNSYGDKEIYSFDITVNYDAKAFEYHEIKQTELSEKFQLFFNNATQGTIKIGGFGIESILDSGTYLELVFKVIGKKHFESFIEIESYCINAEPAEYAMKTFVIDEDRVEGVPQEYKLYDNFPNPFNPETTIQYQIPATNYVSLKIFNMLGQPIKELVGEQKKAGMYQAVWEGTNEMGKEVPSGIYIYQITIPNKFNKTKKMLLIK